jgi:hypothetical protein
MSLLTVPRVQHEDCVQMSTWFVYVLLDSIPLTLNPVCHWKVCIDEMLFMGSGS